MNNTITVIDIEKSGISLVTGYHFNDKEYILSARHSSPLAVDSQTRFFDRKQLKETLLERMNKTKSSLADGNLGGRILLVSSEGFEALTERNSSTAVAGERVSFQDYASCNLRLRRRCEGEKANYTAVSIVPYSFLADNTSYKSFPSGIKGQLLTVYSDAQRLPSTIYSFFQKRRTEIGRKPYLAFFSAYARTDYRNSTNAPSEYLVLDLNEQECTLSYVSQHRLLRTRPIGCGIGNIIYDASKKLNISYSHCKELINLFGISGLCGFPYQGNDVFTAEERKEAFSKSLEPISLFLKNTGFTNVPLFLTGEYGNLVGLKEELSKQTGLRTQLFSAPLIGAKDACYLPCIGAIRLSSYSYQPTPAEGSKTQQQYDLGKEPFKRD